MLNFRFFAAVYVLLGVTWEISASFPYLEHQNPYSVSEYFIYTSSEPSAVSSGYTYATQDFNGGASNVAFASGPNSAQNLKFNMREIFKPMPMMMKEDSKMEMQTPPEQNSESTMPPVMSQNMESEMKSSSDSNMKMSKEQMKPQEDNSAPKKETAFPPQFSLPYPLSQKNPLSLGFPSVVPKYYLLPSPLHAQHIPYDNFAQFSIPPYGLNNPFVRVFYESPFASTVNTLQDVPKKEEKDDSSEDDDERPPDNCGNSSPITIGSRINKIVPASEFVANAIENAAMNKMSTSTSTTEEPKSSTVESAMDMGAEKVTSTTEASSTTVTSTTANEM